MAPEVRDSQVVMPIRDGGAHCEGALGRWHVDEQGRGVFPGRTQTAGTGRPRGQTVVSGADDATAAELAALLRALEQGRNGKNGFPGGSDFDYAPLAPFFAHELNNVSDADLSSTVEHHTKAMEREVVGLFADRVLYPDGLVYLSEAAHSSVHRALDLLGMDWVSIRVSRSGELNYEDLRRMMDTRRSRPAIVVANVGTAATGAVDDVRQVKRVLREL